MTAVSFPEALRWVLTREGGFVNNPADHGGATNEGITTATLEAYRGEPVTAEDVRNVTADEVAAIYRANYWDKVHGDDLPPGVDLLVFDCAVMSRPSRAAQWLQYAVCAAPDGVIGPITLQAVGHASPETMVSSITALRMAFYRQIVARDASQTQFLNGWLSRAMLTKVKAFTMTAPVEA